MLLLLRLTALSSGDSDSLLPSTPYLSLIIDLKAIHTHTRMRGWTLSSRILTTGEMQAELGTRQFFRFATTTTRQRM